MQHMLVVGGGLAGDRAARALRSAGFHGEVTILSEEADRPYDHVPLSKDFLDGQEGYHRLFLRETGFYEEHGINLRLNTPVAGLDVEAKTLGLASGEELPYSAVLLATGASARKLPIPGASGPDALAGVHYLRTLTDAHKLRRELHEAERVVVIGAGFLGCEVAASASRLGKDVTLVSRGPLPLLSALGQEMATVYRDLHAENGTDVLANTQARGLRGDQRVEGVVLADGRDVAADIVVIAVGDEPRSALAEAAGLDVGTGIRTDASLQTSAPGVYAAGDVASVWDENAERYVRRAHFATALTQGPLAARSMLGEPVRYDAVPFFFSDQYGVWMEYTGEATNDTELVIHGDVAARRFVAFWVHDGRLIAAMNMGLRGVPDAVTPLIHAGQQVDGQTLARIVDAATPA